MEKKIAKEKVYYKITWSKPADFTRHTVTKVTSLPGIVCVFKENSGIIDYLLFYACWKSGIKNGARNLLDPQFSLFPEMIKQSEKNELKFKHAVVDTTPLDMKDIIYWLITAYEPELNNIEEFADSERYKEIFLKEVYEFDEKSKKI